ncbi:hypothetical protein QQF64_033899 [Cirrhinus molitorella]|uniref:DDE Tnp4 domain-containing protein n=1 Tax=Cirrhinus molitorella TaxID=172907 RepID=A0ABR3MVB1_9TELE
MVECTFGILAAQWRLYHRVLGVSPKIADAVVKATCILHNFLCFEDTDEEKGSCTPLPSEQQIAMQPIQRVGSNNALGKLWKLDRGTPPTSLLLQVKFMAAFSHLMPCNDSHYHQDDLLQ